MESENSVVVALLCVLVVVRDVGEGVGGAKSAEGESGRQNCDQEQEDRKRMRRRSEQ